MTMDDSGPRAEDLVAAAGENWSQRQAVRWDIDWALVDASVRGSALRLTFRVDERPDHLYAVEYTIDAYPSGPLTGEPADDVDGWVAECFLHMDEEIETGGLGRARIGPPVQGVETLIW